jgi:hypothetical protein
MSVRPWLEGVMEEENASERVRHQAATVYLGDLALVTGAGRHETPVNRDSVPVRRGSVQ